MTQRMANELSSRGYRAAGAKGWGSGALLVLAVVLACGAPPILAQTSASDEKNASAAVISAEGPVRPADQAMADRIDDLIALIGSPDYRERTAATQDLISIGQPAFAQLQEANRRTDDLEVVLQIERIVHTAFLNESVFSQHGFLGISLWAYPRPRREGPPVSLPEGTAAIELAKVIGNTGAERAGLREKDVIIAVDGSPLEGSGQELVNNFSQGISGRRPGDKMILTVVRPDGQQDIEVILGRVPPELARSGSVRAVHEKLRDAEQRFQNWWPRHFRASEANLFTKTAP